MYSDPGHQRLSLARPGEVGYRLFDPYPHYPSWEINRSEHGNLSQVDESLGWNRHDASRCAEASCGDFPMLDGNPYLETLRGSSEYEELVAGSR